MKIPQEQFKIIQKALLGQKPLLVKQGYGSSMTLDFSNEWHIWIYCCSWQILNSANSIQAHSESSQNEIAAVLEIVQSSVLTTLEYDPQSFEITLGFANGFIIKLTPNDEYYEDAEYMMIYTPDKHVLSFGPQKQLSYESSDQSSIGNS